MHVRIEVITIYVCALEDGASNDPQVLCMLENQAVTLNELPTMQKPKRILHAMIKQETFK